MFKFVRLIIFVLVLFTLFACAPVAAPTPVPPTATAPSVVTAPTLAPAPAATAFDARRAYDHNQMLAVTIGKRVASTEGGTRAGDYIAQQFKSFGFTVEKQAFPFESWEDHGTQVQVTAPEERPIQARPIQYSPPGNVEAELVSVRGNGTESDFGNVDVKGRVALVQRGTIPFSDKAINAAKAGAAAVLIYNTEPIAFTGTLRDPVSIPAIALSGTDGRSLLDLLAKGSVKVKVTSDTAVVQKTGQNIVATKRGSSDGVIVLGGHYDSVDAGPGAGDNGSGTAVLLELARVLGQQPHKNTLVFIAFDAEELGLYGSRYYVERLSAADRANIKGMLNFDMLGGGSGPLLAGGDGTLGRLTRDAAEQLGIQARNFQLGGNAGSDHEPFQRVGIDTVFFSRDYDLLHTPQDTIDQIQEAYLGEAGRVGERVVTELDQKAAQSPKDLRGFWKPRRSCCFSRGNVI
ncbi:MAG: M28 family peptidase [Chloroflexi bacterium]|nr:M28 family peptidase [Chloroflexota bacterium]